MTESFFESVQLYLLRGVYGTFEAQASSRDRLRVDSRGTSARTPAAALAAFAEQLALLPPETQWRALTRFESGDYDTLEDAVDDERRPW